MMGIKCGAEFRVRHALAIEFDGHRKCAKAPLSIPVIAVNSARGVLPGPAEKGANRRG
jgi:hypothetical protein